MNNNISGLFNFCSINDELQSKNSPYTSFVFFKPLTKFSKIITSLKKISIRNRGEIL